MRGCCSRREKIAVRTSAFQDLQRDETGHADRKISSAFDERQRQRLIGRNSKHAAQQDQAGLLGAERAWNYERRAADGLHKAFDHECFADGHRVSHAAEHDENFQHADQPPDHVH